ncbi:MAG: hypothetical protein ACLGJB_08275 [Blastocatellia bacterium]
MSIKILNVSHPNADAWIAFDEKEGFDYYYGGTRMVPPATAEPDVVRIVSRLMSEESEFKNRLINKVLTQETFAAYNGRMPEGFLGSKVGGARCILRPRDEKIYATLQNPANPDFDATISGIFERLGGLLNEHGGMVKLTPDFGRYAGMADILARFTTHVLGIRCEAGGCGGKSSYAATGIITALEMLGISDYQDKPVTLIGSAGALGSDVLKYLSARGFADLAVCDLVYDDGTSAPPPGVQKLTSKMGALTEECLKRGGMIIATTYGEELENSNWKAIPPGSVLVLAHNLSVPLGSKGLSVMKGIAARNVYSVPGQVLTLGGALTSRLEWFWRKSRSHVSFDKELAHLTVREVEGHLLSKITRLVTSFNMTPFEAMLHYADAQG